MVLTAIKKYPNQISTAFKRFPLASSFAVFSTIAFFIVYEGLETTSEQSARFLLWLAIYPIAAMFIALDTSLVQEALKNRNPKIQAITGIAWFVISWLIVLYPNTLNDYEMSQTIGALVFIYTTLFLGLFVAPFFRQKNENAFWIHLTKTVKSLVVSTIVAGLLLLAMELLFLGFFGLFGFTDPSERPFLYIFIFCTSSGIRSERGFAQPLPTDFVRTAQQRGLADAHFQRIARPYPRETYVEPCNIATHYKAEKHYNESRTLKFFPSGPSNLFQFLDRF